MSILSVGNSNFKTRIYDKTLKCTDLDSKLLIWYVAFCDSATLSDGVVMYGDAKHDLQNFMLNADAIINRKKTLDKFGTYTKRIDYLYDTVCNTFEKMKLIDYITSGSGAVYPRIIGYNYYNDPEFYIAYRKKFIKKFDGKKEDEDDISENWNGRFPMPISSKDVMIHINLGYEFREKDLIQHFFN